MQQKRSLEKSNSNSNQTVKKTKVSETHSTTSSNQTSFKPVTRPFKSEIRQHNPLYQDLESAIFTNDVTRVSAIVSAIKNDNLNISHRYTFSNTALHRAVKSRNPAIVRILLNHHADMTLANDSKELAVFNAVAQDDLELVKEFLEHRTNRFDLTIREGRKNISLLQKSLFSKSTHNVFHYLVERFKDSADFLDSQDSDGNSVLHLAMRLEHIELIKKLLTTNINIHLQNNKKKIAIELTNNPNIIAMYRSFRNQSASNGAAHEHTQDYFHNDREEINGLREEVSQLKQQVQTLQQTMSLLLYERVLTRSQPPLSLPPYLTHPAHISPTTLLSLSLGNTLNPVNSTSSGTNPHVFHPDLSPPTPR